MNGSADDHLVLQRGLHLLNSFRVNFYALHPNETYYDTFQAMPDFTAKAGPGMVFLMVLEVVIKMFSNAMASWRLYDSMVNISTGVLSEAFKSFTFRGAELAAYLWIYNNYRLLSLPYDSPYTYLFTMLGVDFGYYCWHRASHEISIMWASHYVHHSSDDFTMTTAIRSPVTMRISKWFWFMHLAFVGVPPVTFIVHLQLTYVYGAWSHNECIPKLGKVIPILGDIYEFIMITPSHHRVHHGANKYCIDKNYGQVFVIWDRMFGTYAEEREDQELTYGTIENTKSFDIIGIQIKPYVDLWKKIKSMDCVENKVKALFYGPGWSPGKPRLGNEEEIPDVRGRMKYELHLPKWFTLYLSAHVSFLFFAYFDMLNRLKTLDGWVPSINFCYLLLAMTSLGGLYDAKFYSLYLEPMRLGLYVVLSLYFPMLANNTITYCAVVVYIVSFVFYPSISNYIQSQGMVKEATGCSEEYKERETILTQDQQNKVKGSIERTMAVKIHPKL